MGARKDEGMDAKKIARSMRNLLPLEMQKVYDAPGSTTRVLVDVVAAAIADAEDRADYRADQHMRDEH